MARMTVDEALALGHAHMDAGRLDQAEAVAVALLESAGERPEVHRLAGLLAYWRGNTGKAVEYLATAVEMAPAWAMAHENLAFFLHLVGEFEGAEQAARQALALESGHGAHCNLAQALREQGRFEESIESFRAALRLNPNDPVTHGGMLYSMQFLPGIQPETLAQEHAEWDRRNGLPMRYALPLVNVDRDPNRPLRVGFVSPDLGRHPVGHFVSHFIEHLRGKNLALYCYSDRRRHDEVSERIKAASDVWHRTLTMSDLDVAKLIRDDRIDILFDLAGHTAGNRLMAFARKPAPIQITWMGYVGTTGLSAMDYLLADRWHVPPGAEGNYREKVLRMPNGYICYCAPPDSPAVGPLPALERGYVTFGSFNKATKCNRDVIALWAEILRRVPNARLTMRNKGLQAGGIHDRIVGQFEDVGIEVERLELNDWAKAGTLLEHYNQIDIGLDTFPYSGGLTTCEALWMGVPVVTCPGRTFAGRHSLSHSSNAGLTETIAASPAEYVEKAVSLANDLPRLVQLRRGLREQMANSPLCNPAQFASDLAELLRNVWRGSTNA